MMRFTRAFWKALQMTLRGEAPPPRPYAPLWAWMQRGAALVSAVYAEAEAKGMDKTARHKLMLRIEGRDVSVQTILGAFEYHITQEYPYLLKHPTQHGITAIYASNMNDQFHLTRLQTAEVVQSDTFKQAVDALVAHVYDIPPSTQFLQKQNQKET